MTDTWQVGDVIADQYRVLEVHGQGGMGLVHRIQHLTWDIELAVKSPRPELLRTGADRDRFVTEAETWVSLGLHPHVCGCHYVRVLDGTPRVFAEYLSGGSIRDRIDDRQLYQGTSEEVLARLLDLAVQTAWGLQHAHDHGLVHQDVKPANILLTGDGTAKVTDFGLARARQQASGHRPVVPDDTGVEPSVLVSSGGLTPAYASPEQFARQPLGRRTDVFSLAVSILEMFTGGIHWRVGPAAGAALEEHLRQGPVEPHLPAVPPALAGLLRRCLHDDPAERPATMNEVAAGLIAVHEGALGTPYPRPEPPVAALRADGLSNRGLSLMDIGRMDEADQAFTEALEADPYHIPARYNRGLLRWQTHRSYDDEIAAELFQARWATRDASGADQMIAQFHLARGALDDAMNHLNDAAKREPENPRVGILLDRYRAGEFGDTDRMKAFDRLGKIDDAVVSTGSTYVLFVRAMDRNSHDLVLWDASDDAVVAAIRHDVPVPLPSAMPDPPRLAGSATQIADIAPDGLVTVSGDMAGGVWVWDMHDSGSLRHQLSGHTAQVTAVRVNAGGSQAVTGAADGSVFVWDLATGARTRIAEPRGNRHRVPAVDLSADGNRVLHVAMERRDETWTTAVRVTDLAAGKVAVLDLEEPVRSVAFGPAGHFAALGGATGSVTFWFPFGEDNARRIHGAHPGPVTMIGLCRNGEFVVSGDEGGTVRIWSGAETRCLRSFDGTGGNKHREKLMSIGLLPQGKYAVTATGRAVRYWNVPRGYQVPMVLCRPQSHADLVTHIALADSLVREATEAIEQERYPEALGLLQRARAVPGHGSTDSVRAAWRHLARHAVRFTIRSAEPRPPLTGHRGSVHGLRTGDDPGLVATAGEDGTVRLWDVAEGRCTRTIEADTGGGHGFALSRNGETMATLGDDSVLRWWKLDGDPVVEDSFDLGDRDTPGPRRAALSAHGRRLLFCSPAFPLRMYYRKGPDRVLGTLTMRNDGRSEVIGIDGAGRIGAVNSGGIIHLWYLDNGQYLGGLNGHQQVTSLAVHRDRHRLLSTGGEDSPARLWDLDSGECLKELDAGGRHQSGVSFSPEGRFAATCVDQQDVWLWHLETGRHVFSLDTDGRRPIATEFTADGRFLLAATHQGPLLAWELDWDLEAREAADWDPDAERPLMTFLDELGTAATADDLLRRLGHIGFGWLRPEGVRAAIDRMAPEPPWVPWRLFRSAPVEPVPPPPGGRLARTVEEAEAYIQFLPCPECGNQWPVLDEVVAPPADGRAFTARCVVRCNACEWTRAETFEIAAAGRRSGTPAQQQENRFGGSEPSRLLDPGQWLAYADLRLANVPEIGTLDRAQAAHHARRADRALAAVIEAAKFLPRFGRQVPEKAFWVPGADPSRFTRAALAKLEQHCRERSRLLWDRASAGAEDAG